MWQRIFSSSKGPSPETPLARGSPQQADDPDLTPLYQSWHEFNTTTAQWETVPNAVEYVPPQNFSQQTVDEDRMTLATWNVDAFSPLPNDRLSAILSRMLDQAPAPDIIFLQEVCKPMVPFIMQDERIRSGWYSSEKDTVQWRGQLFATMVLISKSRFGHLGKTASGILGRVSRIKYRTRYGRDALCSEILLPTSTSNPNPGQPAFKRIQLVNVHLDSLAVTPSRRPHQLSVVAKLLHNAGHGLVAGDFNPVLPEDGTLIEENKLEDAWKALRGEEPGYTWGVDGTEPFPPNRMDRVAMVGLTPLHVEVMHPETIALPKSDNAQNRAGKEGVEAEKEQTVPWSDHSGLKCTFTIDG
ncbi:endonuclease exonuclease phosphatase family protein [Colletotrichum karsti]|uniref:Endonuclease exonuclease phosphatase family protein n=1 Tax=Colletotrichum karsti TaxID=1095194 RepID=A0A9P6I9A9_9PEZI|nr:endonuclease exonuclease phosphatase family protein [Colletotrichum karsti]KAF9879548.1 endonuclease exonuclease phosphatase family protein [Colletotrichum karsti]